MEDQELENWGVSIIERVKEESIRFSNNPLEFSVFYSPLRVNPKLMIIGDNPGGQVGESGLSQIPKIHEYIDPDPQKRYLIADIMREKILKGEKLRNILSESVKTNRIFFRSPDLKTLNSFENINKIIDYCRAILIEIIQVIRPQNILAESISTFKSLSHEEKPILIKPNSKKSLLLMGQFNGIRVFGINHPSNAFFHKINDSDWELVNKELEKRLQ